MFRAVASCLLLSLVSSACFADRVQYDFTFDATWSPETHPGFPANGHFSGVFGATHNSDFTLWEAGELASPGIQQIAEIGTSTIAISELAVALENGSARRQIGASGMSLAPYTVNSKFSIFTTHPMVSLATMIAPSPDWLVGTSRLSLVDEQGNWLPEVSVDLYPYDAGTDSGVNFQSANEVTTPFQPITRISEFPFEGLPPLGTFTFTLLSLSGDANGSGEVDAGDIATLCSRIGRSLPTIDLAGNPELIELDDAHAFVERIMGTRLGDTDLDGTVGFEDFLTLSGNFGQNASWEGGDFDCNQRVEFADFLSLSQNFGFERAAAVAAVPEPSSIGVLLFGLLTLNFFRKRR